MDFIKDIFINLLSNAIWAIAGFVLARFTFLKKPSLSSNRLQAVLKKEFLASYRVHLFFEKSYNCDFLLKKI